MPPPDIATGLYRHYKGHPDRVLGTVRHSESGDWLVLYQALYGDRGLWVRPAAMFAETVEVDGRTQPRFALERAEPGLDSPMPLTRTTPDTPS